MLKATRHLQFKRGRTNFLVWICGGDTCPCRERATRRIRFRPRSGPRAPAHPDRAIPAARPPAALFGARECQAATRFRSGTARLENQFGGVHEQRDAVSEEPPP